jgi:hypothetical protein
MGFTRTRESPNSSISTVYYGISDLPNGNLSSRKVFCGVGRNAALAFIADEFSFALNE